MHEKKAEQRELCLKSRWLKSKSSLSSKRTLAALDSHVVSMRVLHGDVREGPNEKKKLLNLVCAVAFQLIISTCFHTKSCPCELSRNATAFPLITGSLTIGLI